MLDYGRALQVQTDGQLFRVYCLGLVIATKLEGQEEHVALHLGELLSTFVATFSVSGGAVSLPTKEAFLYCSYVMVIGFIIIGTLTLFAREVIGERMTVKAKDDTVVR
jgi:hypothetical protein